MAIGLFSRKADPITERARELAARIADLQSRIKKLDQRPEHEDRPRLRSTAYPRGSGESHDAEPVFERVDQNQLKEAPEPLTTARHFNELGARKYNLVAFIERVKRHFRGPPAANPKLINYLAAGNIQGLRPLRYETRVARNRFIALTVVFVVVLFGIFYFLVRRH